MKLLGRELTRNSTGAIYVLFKKIFLINSNMIYCVMYSLIIAFKHWLYKLYGLIAIKIHLIMGLFDTLNFKVHYKSSTSNQNIDIL